MGECQNGKITSIPEWRKPLVYKNLPKTQPGPVGAQLWCHTWQGTQAFLLFPGVALSQISTYIMHINLAVHRIIEALPGVHKCQHVSNNKVLYASIVKGKRAPFAENIIFILLIFLWTLLYYHTFSLLVPISKFFLCKRLGHLHAVYASPQKLAWSLFPLGFLLNVASQVIIAKSLWGWIWHFVAQMWTYWLCLVVQSFQVWCNCTKVHILFIEK